jgi:signal transduction histidine kinase
LGFRLWPGVALGAFLVNALTDVPLATAAGIAVGNTLEALSGAYLLHRLARFRNSLERLQDVLGLVVLAAVLSTTVSATIGVTSLCVGGAAPWGLYGSLWWQWWLGDAMGALVVTPVLLTWGTAPRFSWPPGRAAEAGALLLGVVAVSHVVFGGWFTPDLPNYPLAYAVFPFVIWAALRFGQQGAATATLTVSALAVSGTLRGVGVFGGETVTEGLLLLQAFMSVVAVTALVLGAAIAERRWAEEALRVANARLEQAARRAERASRHKSEFLANMSHELRTPLNAIIGFSALLEQGLHGPLTPKQARFVANIHKSGKHLLTVINDILDLTRVEVGRLKLALEPVGLAGFVEEVLTVVREGAPAKRPNLTSEVPAGLPPAVADPVRLRQILYNLLSNAVKFTSEEGTVTVGAESLEGDLAVWVRDTGIGIAPEDQERIFREFEQVDGSFARQYQGTGLGLALTRKLVELHGGRIWVESAPGKGSTFTFTLPHRVPGPAPAAHA